jgi:ABC-type polar amino acid transport system ATPase subunit
MADVIIRARDFHKHFGALHVLRGVNLEIARGEGVVIIGPSGSGKRQAQRALGRAAAAGGDRPGAGDGSEGVAV